MYRQMFRLEANRLGAEVELAIALLRGWVAADSETDHAQLLAWLKKVCPICLLMIEAAQRERNAGKQCRQ